MSIPPETAKAELPAPHSLGPTKQAFYLLNLVLAAVYQVWAWLHLPYFGVSSLEFDRLLGNFFLLQALLLPVLGWVVLGNVAGQTGSQKFRMLKILDLSRFRLVVERIHPDVPLFLLPLAVAPLLVYSLLNGFSAFFWGYFLLFFALFIAILQVSLTALLIGLLVPGRLHARILLLLVFVPSLLLLFPAPSTKKSDSLPPLLKASYLLTYPTFLTYARGPELPIPIEKRDPESFPYVPQATVFPPDFFDLLVAGIPEPDPESKSEPSAWFNESWTPAHAGRTLPAQHITLSGVSVLILFLLCAKLVDRL